MSCGACPAFAGNLCDALTRCTITETSPELQPQDHTAQARRSIWREDVAVDGVPVICQGWAATAMTLPDGRRQILSFVLPGDLVSAKLIFDPVSHYSVDAVTDLRYRTFPREAVKAALNRQPDLLALVSKMSAEEAARADRLSIDLGRRVAAERIASLIINLAERLLARGMMQGPTMDFPLRQHHIADAAGLTVVHVGNIMSDFRRAGLLEISDRSLTILDAAALRRVADAA